MKQQLQTEIHEAEQTLESIERQQKILMDKGARTIASKIQDINKELVKGGLSCEHEAQIVLERDDLYKDPVWLELRSYLKPRREAIDKLFRAKDRLDRLLAEKAPIVLPADPGSPGSSGDAESKILTQLWRQVTGLFGAHHVHQQEKVKAI